MAASWGSGTDAVVICDRSEGRPCVQCSELSVSASEYSEPCDDADGRAAAGLAGGWAEISAAEGTGDARPDDDAEVDEDVLKGCSGPMYGKSGPTATLVEAGVLRCSCCTRGAASASVLCEAGREVEEASVVTTGSDGVCLDGPLPMETQRLGPENFAPPP